MMYPKISIIIPVFNSAEYLSEAIESIISQTFTDWEIIVTDDGSTDNSYQILKYYANKIPLTIVTQKNQGLSSARNSAIRVSRGEYIAFLDADDMFCPDKLEKQFNTFIENPRQIMSYTNIMKLENSKIIKFNQKTYSGMIFDNLFYSNNFIPVMTVIVKKSIIEKYGLFNTSLKVAQDYDLWLKIAENYEIFCFSEPLSIYRIHNNNISKNIELMMEEEKNIMQKWINKYPYFTFSHKYYKKNLLIYYNLLRYYIKTKQYNKIIKHIKEIKI